MHFTTTLFFLTSTLSSISSINITDEDSSLPFKSRILGVNSGIKCSSKGLEGVCTFLWHCRGRGGQALAPCRKGILVGTCCHLPVTDAKEDPPLNSLNFNKLHFPVTFKPTESSHLENVGSTESSMHRTSSSWWISSITDKWNTKTNVRTKKPVTIPTYSSTKTTTTTTTEKYDKNTSPDLSTFESTLNSMSMQSIIHSLASAEGAGEVTYAPSNQWIYTHPTTQRTTLTGVTYLSDKEYSTRRPSPVFSFSIIDHQSNETHDFPLGEIQQIIEDFSKKPVLSDPESWWQSESNVNLNGVTNSQPQTDSTQSNVNLQSVTTWEPQTDSIPQVTVFNGSFIIRNSTLINSQSVEPVKLPVISVFVSNSTSVVESVTNIQEVSYIDETIHKTPLQPTTTITTTPKPATITFPTIKFTTTTRKTTTPRRKISRRPTRRTTTTIPTTTTTKPWNYKTDCGVRPLTASGRIVGGKKAALGQWPWQVLIKEATFFGWVVKTKCGGVLISRKYVITAAHCQPRWFASLMVILGEFDLAGENEYLKPIQRNIRRVIAHRDFVPATFENDIALLEMERPVDLQPHIVPVCLPPKDTLYTGKTAIVSGWGRLTHGGSLPSVLHYVDVPILSNSACQQMFLKAGQVKTIKNSFVCAGFEKGGKDSCEGDSGGPLTVQGEDGRWILVGTVSHGIKCAYENLPGVYTRISAFRDWIDRFVKS